MNPVGPQQFWLLSLRFGVACAGGEVGVSRLLEGRTVWSRRPLRHTPPNLGPTSAGARVQYPRGWIRSQVMKCTFVKIICGYVATGYPHFFGGFARKTRGIDSNSGSFEPTTRREEVG